MQRPQGGSCTRHRCEPRAWLGSWPREEVEPPTPAHTQGWLCKLDASGQRSPGPSSE